MWRLYSLQYKGAMPAMAETSHQAPRVRNTGRREGLSQPIYVEGPQVVKGRGRDQTMCFLMCFPFPPAPWFYSCRKDQARTVKIAESGHVCGASERLSQRWGQRTKPCAEAELSSWRDTAGWGQAGHSHCGHRQEALGSRDIMEPCLAKMKNQKHFALRELERGCRLSLVGFS